MAAIWPVCDILLGIMGPGCVPECCPQGQGHRSEECALLFYRHVRCDHSVALACNIVQGEILFPRTCISGKGRQRRATAILSVWQGKRLSQEMKAQRLQECRGWDAATAAALHCIALQCIGVLGPLFITRRAALLSSCTELSEPLREVFKWCPVLKLLTGL